MKLSIFLRISALVYMFVGGLHLVLGEGAETMMGALEQSHQTIDPVRDSQSRFYGVYFGATGLFLWLSAQNLDRWRSVLLISLAALFAGGLARIVSIFVAGLPSAFVIALAVSELVLPPLVWIWLRAVTPLK